MTDESGKSLALSPEVQKVIAWLYNRKNNSDKYTDEQKALVDNHLGYYSKKVAPKYDPEFKFTPKIQKQKETPKKSNHSSPKKSHSKSPKKNVHSNGKQLIDLPVTFHFLCRRWNERSFEEVLRESNRVFAKAGIRIIPSYTTDHRPTNSLDVVMGSGQCGYHTDGFSWPGCRKNAQEVFITNVRGNKRTGLVIAHEIGHMLGLGHTQSGQNNLMEPTSVYTEGYLSPYQISTMQRNVGKFN